MSELIGRSPLRYVKPIDDTERLMLIQQQLSRIEHRLLDLDSQVAILSTRLLTTSGCRCPHH